METKVKINEEKIKTFLKLTTPKTKDNPYYQISSDKKSLLLLNNPKIKNENEKNEKYSFDKIFTENNENSYIYEEIMRNCIQESLSGIHFSFISYGDSNSENREIIFGKSNCYENINNRGIFPRCLENYIIKISNDKKLNENLALNVSYLMVNNNNLIDLSKFIGMESNEILKITANDLLKKYSIEIKNNNTSLINKIKKVPCENIKDILYFLTKFFDNLHNLEMDGTHLLNWSHFTFIIYINDNSGNIISTISFIILGCNDIISSNSNYNINLNYKNELINIKSDIIKYVNNNKNETIVNQSKLISFLEKISFNEKNIYRQYRIIGTLYPDNDSFLNVKDTIEFLSNCKKISNKGKKSRFSILHKRKKSKTESEKKDDVIKDLESKIKVQEKKIEELNNLVEYKQIKSDVLKVNYKKQIECLKEAFNFTGNLDHLLKDMTNSKEKKFTENIRNAIMNNEINENKIKDLQNKIINIKEETKKILTIQGIKNTDEALVKIYTEIKEEKLAYEKQIKLRNEHSKNIEILKEKNKILNELLNRFKKENEIKNDIIKNLPNAFHEKIESKNKIEADEEKITNDIKKHFKKEMNDLEKNYIKENNIIIKKYENLINQKENQMKKTDNEINEINKKMKMAHSNFEKEIYELYKIIDDLITNYKKFFEQKKAFSSDINEIKNFIVYLNIKYEFDKIIDKYEKNVNRFKFPLLFNELDEKGIERKKTKIIVYKTKEKEQPTNHIALENKLNNNSIPINILQKENEQIFGDLLIKNEEDFNKMDKVELINYFKKIKGKLKEIEEFNTKYIDYNEKYDNNLFKSNEEIINELYNKIDKQKKLIDEFSLKYNNVQNIESTHKKMIEKLNMENFMLMKKLNEKNINDKISFGLNSNFPTTSNWNISKKDYISKKNFNDYKNINSSFGNITKNYNNKKNFQNNSFNRPTTAIGKNNINENNSYLKFPES